jgi:hypothetical protein
MEMELNEMLSSGAMKARGRWHREALFNFWLQPREFLLLIKHEFLVADEKFIESRALSLKSSDLETFAAAATLGSMPDLCSETRAGSD